MKTKQNKHSLALRLCAIATLLCLLLTGCGGEGIALVYNGVIIDEGMYRYWLSSYKYTFLNQYNSEDSADFFAQKATDSATYGDYFAAQAEANIRSNLISMYLFDQYELELDTESTKEVDQSLSSRISEFGTKEKMNESLSKMGMDYDALRQLLLNEAKVRAVVDYLYGNKDLGVTGTITVSDEDVNAFYEKHYGAFQLILIRTDSKNVLNEDGSARTDADGKIITEPFTETERKEKEALKEQICMELDQGVAFTDLQAKYNQDSESASFPAGYLVSDFYSVFSPEISKAVLELNVGEYTVVSDAYGYEIVQRVALPSAAYGNEAYADMMNGFTDYLNSTNFAAMTADAVAQIRDNTDVTDRYSFVDADISYFTHSQES